MSPITTHVLDTALGKPAEGITVRLFQVQSDGSSAELAVGTTDVDGRATNLLAASAELSGTYRLEFDTAAYFARSGRNSFYPRVDVLFEVSGDEHYHVPLLLSPFGYSTYRGT